MAVPDYSQPDWQTPQGNEGTVLAGIIQRSKQQQMEQSRLGMEQQQFQRQVAGEGSIQDIAAKAAAKSAAQSRLQKYLTPQTEGGYGMSPAQVAATDPATWLTAGQPLPQQQKPFNVPQGATAIDPTTGKPLFQSPPRPAAPQRPTVLRPGEQAIGSDGKPIASLPAAAPKPTATFSEDTETLPSGEQIFGQRNSLTQEFKPFSSYGQEGGGVLERAARAAKSKAADALKRQASKDKTALQKQMDDPLALKKIAEQLIAANPKLAPHDAFEQAQKQIQVQIDAKDAILEGGEQQQEQKPQESEHFKAGTKVKNGKGEIKYLKTDGSLPEGWTPAQ